MAIAFRFDTEVGICYAVYDGIITETESIAAVRGIMSSPHWPPARRCHLSDMTTMTPDPTLNQATRGEMQEIWAEYGSRMGNFKVAVVATQTFDQATPYREDLSEYDQTLIVFNSLATACVWLDVDLERSAKILARLRAEARRKG